MMAGIPVVLDFSTVDGLNGYSIRGSGYLELAGSSVASTGDVNGDGFADVIVGSPGVPLSPFGQTPVLALLLAMLRKRPASIPCRDALVDLVAFAVLANPTGRFLAVGLNLEHLRLAVAAQPPAPGAGIDGDVADLGFGAGVSFNEGVCHVFSQVPLRIYSDQKADSTT
jgi:FG-GAP repeat